jgi:hypothetical protein
MVTTPRTQPLGDEKADAGGEKVPRMPHERDESSDRAGSTPRDIMNQARKDVESGKVDTSRAEATDKTYRENLREPRPDDKKP